VQREECANYYQQHDYKILPPQATDKESAEAWWGRVPAIMDIPVNSVIGVPAADSTVHTDSDGCIEVKGYALPSGADGPVVKVEVSGDGEETWTEAEILEPTDVGDAELKWAWSLWVARIRVEKGRGRALVSRATDSKGNTQARCPEWNYRGVAYNGYGEVAGLEVV
jgi:sulfite oxidase